MKCEKWRYKAENALDCPFCGSNSISVMHKDERFIGVNGFGMKKIRMSAYCACNKCHARSKSIKYIGCSNGTYADDNLPIYACGDKAIREWNKRNDMESEEE